MSWVGALLLVTSAYFFGIGIARQEGNRLKALDSMIDLLEFMYRRMSGHRMPLYGLFASFQDKYLEAVGFLPLLRSCRNGLSDIWINALELLPLDDESERELVHFGSELGLLPLDEQLKRIEICLGAITSCREKLRISLPPKQKSIKTVSLLFGALGAIILL